MADRDFDKKDGRWIMVMHEFIDALARIDLSNAEARILWCVMRHAWGFGKSQAELTRARILKYTGLNDAAEWKANKKLHKRNILQTFPQDGKRFKVYKINSKIDTWENLPTGRNLPTGSNKPSQGKRHLIKKTIKENLYYSNSCIVLDALNEISGKQFRYSKESLEPICARMDNGFTLEDCLRVLENKWMDPDLKVQYYRPQTLFRKSYFEGYLNMEGRKRKPTNDKQAKRLEKWQRRYREKYENQNQQT